MRKHGNRREPARVVTARALASMPLPRHDEGAHKDERGRVLVVAGSVEMPGAAVLAAEAALRAGAGKLRIATCRSVAAWVGTAVPESRVFGLKETRAGGISPSAARELADRGNEVDAVVIGPGMVDERAVERLVAALLSRLTVPVVLDAGAISGATVLDGEASVTGRPVTGRPVTGRPVTGRPVVVTPHEGEFARLAGAKPPKGDAARLEAARAVARRFGAVVVLKGPGTLTVAPDGRAYRNTTGNVGLATSGSGDTLAGVIAGLVARGADTTTAAVWGVFAHGRAGDRLSRRVGRVGFLARELLAEIPAVLRTSR